jgi:hypothetical protein
LQINGGRYKTVRYKIHQDMKRITFYNMRYASEQTIALPAGSVILGVQVARSTWDEMYLYVISEDGEHLNLTESRTFHIFESNVPFEETPGTFRKYITSVQEKGKQLHIFELLAAPLKYVAD